MRTNDIKYDVINKQVFFLSSTEIEATLDVLLLHDSVFLRTGDQRITHAVVVKAGNGRQIKEKCAATRVGLSVLCLYFLGFVN